RREQGEDSHGAGHVGPRGESTQGPSEQGHWFDRTPKGDLGGAAPRTRELGEAHVPRQCWPSRVLCLHACPLPAWLSRSAPGHAPWLRRRAQGLCRFDTDECVGRFATLHRRLPEPDERPSTVEMLDLVQCC